jgi:hypothetical protein
MRTLYVDTATTGRFLYRESNSDHRQPHLCRLALLEETHGSGERTGTRYVRLIKPLPTWHFDPGAIAGHNITRDDALRRGVSLIEAMQTWKAMLAEADEIVAFNWEFHRRVLAKALIDLGDTMIIPPGVRQTCAMRAATDIVRKPRMDGPGYAWPKQAEALRYFGAGAELPPIEGDPIERGRALVDSLRVIHQGTLDLAGGRP